ncbi:MAG: hypothetical protein Q8Q33_05120, partial [Chlamydiota bacterium]|nr:hypothetical protein [Chlamydiota bacterium]
KVASLLAFCQYLPIDFVIEPFLFTPENFPGSVGINDENKFNEQTMVGCGSTDTDSNLQWTIQCLGFSGSYVLVTDIANFSKISNSPSCTESSPNLFTIPVTVTPSLPGDCVVTSITGADITGDGCDQKA